MPLRYYPRGVVVYVLRAVGGLEVNLNAITKLVKILKIFEESRQLRGLNDSFQPDTVTGLLFTPAVILGALCKEHARDSAVFDIFGSGNGDPNLHSGAVGGQC